MLRRFISTPGSIGALVRLEAPLCEADLCLLPSSEYNLLHPGVDILWLRLSEVEVVGLVRRSFLDFDFFRVEVHFGLPSIIVLLTRGICFECLGDFVLGDEAVVVHVGHVESRVGVTVDYSVTGSTTQQGVNA